MLFNYIKVTLRNIGRSKINSGINLLGLSFGIACSILIILFVKDELTFDKFHSNIKRLYRVTTSISRDGSGRGVEGMTPFVVGLTVKDEIPDIEAATVHTSYNDMVEHGETKFRELISIVSPDFFKMFDFKVIDGSTAHVFENISDVVVTREMANKYFNRTNIAGETISINLGGELKDFNVAAVLEDVPSNSSLQFQFLIGDKNLKYLFQERALHHWFMIAGEAYVMLKPGMSVQAVESKFPAMIKKGLGEERYDQVHYTLGLQPMADIHLGPQMSSIAPISDPKYTFILSAIAVLILIIGSINFITISLAKSIKRAREIGVRKSVGAIKGQIIKQFLMESVILTFLALVIGILLAWIALPWFNELSQKRLVFSLDLVNISLFMGLALLVAFLAGFYPALIISAFKPTKILKGRILVGGGKQRLRTIMLGAQFVVTIFLLTGTLMMKKQISYMLNTNLGYDKSQVMMVPMNVNNSTGDVQMLKDGMLKAEKLKNVLLREPEIVSVGTTSHDFGPGSWTNISFRDKNGEEHNFFFDAVDAEYIPTLGIGLAEGRNFDPDNEADKRRSVIVNEAFVRAFNLTDPIGERIPNEQFVDHEIIGVVKDFNFASLHMPVDPLLFAMNPEIAFSGATGVNLNSDPTPKLAIRVNKNSLPGVIKTIESQWDKVYPGEPFDYSFVDQQLERQYQAEQNLGKLVSSATVLAIIIGSMGLFALSMLTMNAREKEMSIRKVMGASSTQVIYELSRHYLVLVVASFILTVPLSYYIMSGWLSDFAYRADMGLGLFALSGFVALLMTTFSIGYHCVRLVRNSPVIGLRTE